jgi:hypothetical protein
MDIHQLKDKLELPGYKVNQKKAEVWGVMGSHSKLSRETYDHTIRVVNSPAGLVASMVLDEAIRLRRRLNLLIKLGRTFHVVAVAAVIAAAVLWSYWVLLLGFGVELVWYLVIHPRQTVTNVELAATTEVFWEMMYDDPEFRSRAIEVAHRRHGQAVAEGLSEMVEDPKTWHS